ncbi:hypothetical protein [Streptococcus uberis]|uniref:hypothetical protein n=1 Tax=Streptococcus uberis TaxID=1349 RepID=UPI00193C218B|nr:hypothetical protein [Streptococcus uberis]
MKETYHFQLDKDQQRLSKASFQMPEQCSGISLTYSLEEPYTMLVLLMIRDDKRLKLIKKNQRFTWLMVRMGVRN